MNFDLKGKVALVTGGKNGQLGPIWSRTLREAGANVTELDLPDFDITKDDVKHALTWLDEVDILVNNAGIDNPPGSVASFFGNFGKIMNVNINGAARMCEQVIPKMKKKGGVIINIGSIMGNVGADFRNYDDSFEKPVAYNVSKAGLVQLSRSIAVQYGRFNIRSVTISFGPYDGGKIPKSFLDKFLKNVPLGRTISKDSLQMTLLYAVSCPELTGQQIVVDGGYTAW